MEEDEQDETDKDELLTKNLVCRLVEVRHPVTLPRPKYQREVAQLPGLEAGLVPRHLEPGLAEDHGQRLDPGADDRAARARGGHPLYLVWILWPKLESCSDLPELL